MDPLILSTLITSVISMLVTIFNRVESSKCCGSNGVDLEFTSNNNNSSSTTPFLKPVTGTVSSSINSNNK